MWIVKCEPLSVCVTGLDGQFSGRLGLGTILLDRLWTDFIHFAEETCVCGAALLSHTVLGAAGMQHAWMHARMMHGSRCTLLHGCVARSRTTAPAGCPVVDGFSRAAGRLAAGSE